MTDVSTAGPIPNPRNILIYGAGGFAREIAWLAEKSVEPCAVVAFIDDHSEARPTLRGMPVLSLGEASHRFPDAAFVVAVGNPATRRRLVAAALQAGLQTRALVHRGVEQSASVAVGTGTLICAGSILTTDIVVGKHVHINLDCTIGHDAVIEDYVTLAPGVHVSGNVRLETGVYIGTGACIINGTEQDPLVVGANATVGMGAVVTRSVPAGVTVVGNPAKPLARG